jgi:NAD(P)H-hydrate epimerase
VTDEVASGAVEPTILDAAAAAAVLPRRDPRGHKGTFGRLLVVAGSLDFAGAALLAGTAALRTGCGLVTLCLPASVQPHLIGRVPELMTTGLPETTQPGIVEPALAAEVVLGRPHDALVIGPGLLPGPGSQGLVERLLAAPGSPAVVDASAFDALAAWPGWPTSVRRALVLTPHPGELRRLGRVAGTSDAVRARAASAAAAAWRQVVVLKGAGTIVADPGGRSARAPFAVPALGTAGSGDVLAGVVGSLLAQGLGPWDAALLGVFLHARAGEEVSAELGDAGLIATDLLERLPRVRRDLAERQRPIGSDGERETSAAP